MPNFNFAELILTILLENLNHCFDDYIVVSVQKRPGVDKYLVVLDAGENRRAVLSKLLCQ